VPVGLGDPVVFEQPGEELLRQILGIRRRVPAPSDECVERICASTFTTAARLDPLLLNTSLSSLNLMPRRCSEL